MHVNYLYVLSRMRSLTEGKSGVRVLDYGCGRGEVVMAAREAGIHAVGAELFQTGGDKARQKAADEGLLGDAIHEIREGKLDFPDASFDLVTSNQVMEHVEDLEGVLDEIHRVLKPDGVFLALFPSRSVVREGHIGIPFAHWFPKRSRLRYFYTVTLRMLGMGVGWAHIRPCGQWAEAALNYIDLKTFYRSNCCLMEAFGNRFQVREDSMDYIRFRMAESARMKHFLPLLALPLIPWCARKAFHLLAGMVLVCENRK